MKLTTNKSMIFFKLNPKEHTLYNMYTQELNSHDQWTSGLQMLIRHSTTVEVARITQCNGHSDIIYMYHSFLNLYSFCYFGSRLITWLLETPNT
jgi:hypothetical protein